MTNSVIQQNSHSYLLKQYKISEKGLEENGEVFELTFVQGSKDNPIQDGFLTEQLLWIVQEHLSTVNVGDLKSQHTVDAISHIQTAIAYLNERTKDRSKRKVLNTYEK